MKGNSYITALKALDASRRHREPVQGVTVKSCFRHTPRGSFVVYLSRHPPEVFATNREGVAGFSIVSMVPSGM